jgi:hypothetical protein
MSSRSSLYRWMRQNHEEFAAALADAGRPNWRAIAAEFAKDGLTDPDPSPEAVRLTWWKVRKAVEASRGKQATKPSRPPVLKTPAEAPGPPAVTDPAADPANPYGFKPGKLRNT